MHAISTITLLASLATGILAQGLGTFQAFNNPLCGGEPSETVTVADEADGSVQGTLQSGVLSVRSGLDNCAREYRLMSPPTYCRRIEAG